ncbi:hypothetical protein [Nostoc sp. CALU 1950]|uniref:hypothetical protein n=1 Tax=Nostoc sp. CALU 1950 TaxID=3104321 RepID=UPI003EBC09A1
MSRTWGDELDSSVQQTFDMIRPLLIRACKPIAMSFEEIKERYNINVDSAELEVNFNFSATGIPYVVSSKQDSSITIKLHLSPNMKENQS